MSGIGEATDYDFDLLCLFLSSWSGVWLDLKPLHILYSTQTCCFIARTKRTMSPVLCDRTLKSDDSHFITTEGIVSPNQLASEIMKFGAIQIGAMRCVHGVLQGSPGSRRYAGWISARRKEGMPEKCRAIIVSRMLLKVRRIETHYEST